MAGVAAAAEVEGRVQSVDTMAKEISLDSGSKIAWDDRTRIITTDGKMARAEDLKERAKVKASFEEKDGENLADTLELIQMP